MGETRSALGVICSSYDEFFEAEKKIADFMMEHKAEVVDMTVGELARASGTSDATVSRFCRRCWKKNKWTGMCPMTLTAAICGSLFRIYWLTRWLS